MIYYTLSSRIKINFALPIHYRPIERSFQQLIRTVVLKNEFTLHAPTESCNGYKVGKYARLAFAIKL